MTTRSFFSARPKANFNDLFNNNPIQAQLRDHLVNVYLGLCVTLVAATVGVIAHLYANLGGIMSTLCIFGMMIYLKMDQDKNYYKRLAILASIGFFQGCSIGPLMALALDVDPTIIVTAFLGTSVIFICFTISALKADRFQYLALGGVLSSGISFLFLLGIMNIFVQSELMFNASLYLGLLIFCGYVLYDTQVIVEKFRRGDTDFAWHAVELFIDFVGIFVRIVILLLQNQKKEKRRN